MIESFRLGGRLDGVITANQEVRRFAEGLAPVRQVQIRLIPTALVAVGILWRGGGVSGVNIQSNLLHLFDGETAGDRESKFEPFRKLFRFRDAVGRHTYYVDAGSVEGVHALVYFS